MKSLLNTVLIFALLITVTNTKADGFISYPYLVLSSNFGNIQTPTNRIIRTQSEWKAFHKKNTTAHFPFIDFSKKQVVVIASGTKPSGGYQTLVSDVYEISETLYIRAILINPGNTCGATMSLTYPATVFVMPKNKKPVQFSVIDVYRNCN
jgi:hypothetical protein